MPPTREAVLWTQRASHCLVKYSPLTTATAGCILSDQAQWPVGAWTQQIADYAVANCCARPHSMPLETSLITEHLPVGNTPVTDASMTQKTARKRALGGALEGAATGLIVGLARVGIALYRKGLPEQFSSLIPELAGLFFVTVLGCGYVFASGRAIADGLAGSLLGAAILGVCGAFVGSLVPFDVTGTPIPILAGAAAGLLVGSPVGATIHRRLLKSFTGESLKPPGSRRS